MTDDARKLEADALYRAAQNDGSRRKAEHIKTELHKALNAPRWPVFRSPKGGTPTEGAVIKEEPFVPLSFIKKLINEVCR